MRPDLLRLHRLLRTIADARAIIAINKTLGFSLSEARRPRDGSAPPVLRFLLETDPTRCHFGVPEQRRRVTARAVFDLA